jgi:hypothetical protein
MRTAVYALAGLAAASGVSAFMPQAHFAGRAPSLRTARAGRSTVAVGTTSRPAAPFRRLLSLGRCNKCAPTGPAGRVGCTWALSQQADAIGCMLQRCACRRVGQATSAPRIRSGASQPHCRSSGLSATSGGHALLITQRASSAATCNPLCADHGVCCKRCRAVLQALVWSALSSPT